MTTPTRYTRFLLAISLCAIAHPAVAGYWRIQRSSVTAIVEGDQNTAEAVAAMTLRLQSAGRWLLSWPEDHREPPVLVFDVNERLIRQTFKPPTSQPGAYFDATTGHESWARTSALVIVTVPMGYERGHELRSLQHAYGEALLRAEPSHDWPACAQQGMAQLFSAAELTPPNHFYVTGQAIAGQDRIWDPQKILLPADGSYEQTPQWAADERGYSCFLLAFMIASASSEERAALSAMLTAVGRGTPLAQATQSELRQTLPDFTARYRDFARSVQFIANAPSSPSSVSSQPLKVHQVRWDFPEEIPAVTEAISISAENVQALMRKVCERLNNCRK
jgi:hypothetical protein